MNFPAYEPGKWKGRKTGDSDPYRGQRFAETTHGGIVINENGEVIKSKGGKDVIPGLFCAGDASGGWTIDKPMPAISAGNWMVSSGYMAGIAAAKYLGKA